MGYVERFLEAVARLARGEAAALLLELEEAESRGDAFAAALRALVAAYAERDCSWVSSLRMQEYFAAVRRLGADGETERTLAALGRAFAEVFLKTGATPGL